MHLSPCHGIVCGADARGWNDLEKGKMLTAGRTVQDNLRDSRVVPHFRLELDQTSCAEERCELQVLASEIDELQAAPTALQRVAQEIDLHRGERVRAPLSPRAIQRLVAGGGERPSDLWIVQVGVARRAEVLTLAASKVPVQLRDLGPCQRPEERIAHRVPIERSGFSKPARQEDANGPLTHRLE